MSESLINEATLKKESPAQGFFCKFSKIFENYFFIKHLRFSRYLLVHLIDKFIQRFVKRTSHRGNISHIEFIPSSQATNILINE